MSEKSCSSLQRVSIVFLDLHYRNFKIPFVLYNEWLKKNGLLGRTVPKRITCNYIVIPLFYIASLLERIVPQGYIERP